MPTPPDRRRTICCLLALAAMVAVPATAADICEDPSSPPVANLRIDNDLFGAEDQDQGYSNGLQLTLVSPNLLDYTSDACLPAPARWLNRHLRWLHPGRDEYRNMVVGFGQALYTPVDFLRADLVADDRPYAAALLLSLGYNARRGGWMHVSQLRLGMVGPSARGEQVQNEWHDIINVDRFNGWDHQLRDEPVFQVVHEHLWRLPRSAARNADGWGWDAIAHGGFALGNLGTHANAGGELRFGWRLPDDFGSDPLRPSGENAAPRRDAPTRRWSAHVFAAMDGRWVARDITLDGNTFKDSHRVDRRPLVADFGYGFAVTRAGWKLAFARYHRTREFEGQADTPVFGSFTISRAL